MGKQKKNIFIYTLLILGCVIMLYPVAWMLVSSFKPSREVMSMPPKFLPEKFIIDNYIDIYKANFVVYTLNSFLVTTLRTFIPLYTSAILGYIFAKFEFRSKEVIFASIISTMMIPWIVTIIPLYNLMSNFKLINSYSAMVIPFLFSSLGIFMVRSFMHTIPNELIESARIDGCGEFGIFNKIILPIIRPALSALGILLFIAAWDDYLWPFLVVNNDKMFTLPVGLAKFAFTQFLAKYGPVFAGSVVSIVPMLIVYFILQKYIIEGISMTGIKG